MGRRIAAHYELLEKLGEGGTGVVYKARDLLLDRHVALKFLRPSLLDSDDAIRRFLREGRAISALNHPHIATIYAIEEEAGERFLALEYLPGGTLRDRIRAADRRLPFREVVEFGVQVASALAYAHRHDIVHRDVKPGNVLFTAEGVAKLADFGLARQGEVGDYTSTGNLSGTVPYMSPEQAQCLQVDHRTDVFSFGVLLYELASGDRPFDAPSESGLLRAIIDTPTPRLTERRPEVPDGLERIILLATAKDPAERYQTMDAVIDDLQALRPAGATEPPTGSPTLTVPSRPKRQKVQAMRRRLTAIGIAVLAVVLLAFAVRSLLWNWAQPLPEEKQIAVLPFQNIGGGASSEAFTEGLFETLTAKLTQLKQFHRSLRVVPSTEIRREKVTSAIDARLRLGANIALSGSVQWFAQGVRLTVNLLDTRTRSQLRSETMDASTGDLSALQDGVFSRAAGLLELELEPEAQKAVKAGETQKPSAYFLYLEGLGHLARYDRAENLDRALALFDQALHEDPNYGLALVGAGESRWRKYQETQDPALIEQARSRCLRAVEIAHDLVPAHVLLGQIHTGAGRYGDAIKDFGRALQLDPVNADAYLGLARTYERQNRLTEAEAVYRKAVDLRPHDWAGYKDLGVFYSWSGRLGDAEKAFRRVVDLVPDSYAGYRNLGALHVWMGRFDDAIDENRKSIAIFPTAAAYSNLGAAEFLTGRYKDAAAMYEKALAFGTDERVIRGNLAEAYRFVPGAAAKAQGEYRRAMKLAESDLGVNPKNAEVRASLALYAIGVGDRSRAIAEIAKARADAPQNMNVLFRAALVRELAGERTEALEALGAALKQGYPGSEVEHHPDLAKLRRDPRYGNIAAPVN